MTPEERSLLEKTAALAKENNEILRGMRAAARWAALFRFGYWLVIIGVSVAAYLAISPYIAVLEQTYRDLRSGLEKANETVSTVNDAVKR